MDMQAKCSERIGAHLESRMRDLKTMFRPYDCSEKDRRRFLKDLGTDTRHMDSDEVVQDIQESTPEYGLCFDYHAPDETEEQPHAGYWAYVLSTGGPHEEIRLYASTGRRGHRTLHKAEFVLLDWWDGATVDLCSEGHADEWATAKAIWEYFAEIGAVDAALEAETAA